eukprot:gnl/Spiro4/27331_TR13606_c0_g1_i1.p1 gnl/Spiro4/27331_TR13606_c0_g1~~gnl/Spiro4/27331_TR13606_c0_g1_i1.p1  ORF type:complete len:405 (+),score=77.85 gnl/Spiro4/27331_TR13606_c0_g1_i1:171-1385(+)
MAVFHDSTQRMHWMFTVDEVNQLHAQSNQAALARLAGHQQLQCSSSCFQDLTLMSPVSHSPLPATPLFPSTPVQGLTLEEERILRLHWEFKVGEVCEHFRDHFPDYVQWTATIYFKRFFLKRTMMEHDPKYIMLASILLASKVEESAIRLEMPDFARLFGNAFQLDIELLCATEITLLEGLHYHLIVYHPERPLTGFVHEMLKSGLITSNQLPEFLAHARRILARALFSDACFHFSPSHMALAALYATALHTGLDVTGFIQTIFEDARAASGSRAEVTTADDLMTILANIVQVFEASPQDPPDVNIAREIDAKLLLIHQGRTSVLAHRVKSAEMKHREHRENKAELRRKKELNDIRELTGMDQTPSFGKPGKIGAPRSGPPPADATFEIHKRPRTTPRAAPPFE